MSNECTDCDPVAPAPRPETTVTDPLLDPSTFAPPPRLRAPGVIIEFCDRCRWCVRARASCMLMRSCRAPRATWTQTELFLTFPPPSLNSICLQPLNAPETGGRFRVWLDRGQGELVLVWDRKVRKRARSRARLTRLLRSKEASQSSKCSNSVYAI